MNTFLILREDMISFSNFNQGSYIIRTQLILLQIVGYFFPRMRIEFLILFVH